MSAQDELEDYIDKQQEILAACAKLQCIRMFWGAARPCAEYEDGRELCAPCKVSSYSRERFIELLNATILEAYDNGYSEGKDEGLSIGENDYGWR